MFITLVYFGAVCVCVQSIVWVYRSVWHLMVTNSSSRNLVSSINFWCQILTVKCYTTVKIGFDFNFSRFHTCLSSYVTIVVWTVTKAYTHTYAQRAHVRSEDYLYVNQFNQMNQKFTYRSGIKTKTTNDCSQRRFAMNFI